MASDLQFGIKERLRRFALDEPTIWHHLKMAEQYGGERLELTLEKIIYALANDKKQLQEQCKTLIETRTSPIPIQFNYYPLKRETQ